MKISLDWLNAYLDRPTTGDEVAEVLPRQGFPVETREPVAGGDEMLDVEVTSNRSDCLSHVGVARELAAGTGRKLQRPDHTLPPAGHEAAHDLTSVTNDAADLCPYYSARVIRGVKIGPSPAWLVKHLQAIGQASVNNVVDVTNYVLHELGQPLHAFDMARLAERRIVVRKAKQGEMFTAIDGSKHELHSHMLVIADAKQPVAVAGVMGGLDSEITDSTTDVLLEAAAFAPLSVRRTSRKLKLQSDSSYRFERGVDPAGIDIASERAARLIVELAGGALVKGVIREGELDTLPRQISMRVERCNQILGIELSPQQMVKLLDQLKLSPELSSDKASITCSVPPFRLDLEREIDLIEEIARLHDLSNIPVNDRLSLIVRSTQPIVKARRVLRNVMVAHGYHETITFSFVSPKLGKPFVDTDNEAVMIEDERRKAEPMLRPSLLPSLLTCRKSNQDVGNHGVRLFETASVWQKQGGKIVEFRKLAMLCDVADHSERVREVRGCVEELVASLCGKVALTFAPVDDANYLAAAAILLDGQRVGVVGQLAATAQKAFELQGAVVAAELDLPVLLEKYPPRAVLRDLPRFPGIERDLSVVVEEAVAWDAIREQVLSTKPEMMETLDFITTYRGKPIEKGRKSVSFRMLFRDPRKTLRHEQVDPQVAAIAERLKTKLGAELRA
jgi:phenylalanyl-tRNA synthetase beta chain